jgi:hypothetical protein
LGELIIDQDGDPNFGTMAVMFEVTAIVYVENEIINGCTVITNKSTMLICNADHTSIYMAAGNTLTSIREGQIISVRVGKTTYNPYQSQISVNAKPFLPTTHQTVFQIQGDLPADISDTIRPQLEKIKFEEAEAVKLKATKATSYNFIDAILFAWKSMSTKPENATHHSIVDLITSGKFNKLKYVSRDTRITPSTDGVYSFDEKHADAANTTTFVEHLPAVVVAQQLLNDYCEHLRTVREMIEIYNTKELVTTHRNLWAIFEANKKNLQ